MTKESPILFNAPMVRAILDGRKTQTRRIAKVNGEGCKDGFITPLAGFVPRSIENHISYCPYGKPGDRLWVRETWSKSKQPYLSGHIFYRADGETNGKQFALSYVERESKWRPSIHMPRSASRILLEVANVRVERLKDISDEDAIAEGIEQEPGTSHWKNYDTSPGGWRYWESPIQSYRTLWESINGKGSWDLNPFCWVIEFKVIQK